MDTMDIASMSMSLSNIKLQTSVGVAVTQKAMDQPEIALEGVMKMMPPDPSSGLGQYINTKA